MITLSYEKLCIELATNGIEIKSSWDIPYQYLLRVEEWINFRLKVLERDNPQLVRACSLGAGASLQLVL